MLLIVFINYQKIYNFDRIKPLTLVDNSGRINGATEYGDATVSTGKANI